MSKFRIILLACVVFLTISMNFLSNAIPFNDLTTQVISDRYFSYVTPAGFTFAIWGLIYLGLVGYLVYHIRHASRLLPSLNKAYLWFIQANLMNVLWLFLWHYELLGWSVLAMLIILFSLIKVYKSLSIGKISVSRERLLLVHVPISLYLGWISVATIANIASALVQVQWQALGISGVTWAGILICVAGSLGAWMILRRRDYVFGLVIIWALAGIAANFVNMSVLVFGAALAMVIALIIVGVYRVVTSFK